MQWSAETALNELWSGLDLTPTNTNGEVRAYLKRHLQDAYSAGYRDGTAAAEYNDTNATT